MKNSLRNTASNWFKKDEKEHQEKNPSIEAKPIGFFEQLKNNIWGNEPVEIIDIEAFEVIASDMEVMITQTTTEEITVTQELSSIQELEQDKSLFTQVTDSTGALLERIKDTAATSWNFTAEKMNAATVATVSFSSSTADSLVHFTKEVGKKYDNLELTPKFHSLINTLDLVVLITLLEGFTDKQKKGSKEFIALSVIIALLVLLENAKEGMKKEMGVIEVNEELNHNMSSLLQSVTFKDMVETAEPILLLIPNGNYILLILKLFV
ncbi:hypothetical protein ACPDHL_12350 [Myroides sp. C15-4]|uniref:hypothetical protein n=1 Tax=Myroides sp. C15-4 TaxID=3400532 RepID=UPI003D2F5A2A